MAALLNTQNSDKIQFFYFYFYYGTVSLKLLDFHIDFSLTPVEQLELSG